MPFSSEARTLSVSISVGNSNIRDIGSERCLDLVKEGGRVAYPTESSQTSALERAVEEARLRVPIAGVYPLDEAAAAHAHVERGHVLGRVVLQIREEP